METLLGRMSFPLVLVPSCLFIPTFRPHHIPIQCLVPFTCHFQPCSLRWHVSCGARCCKRSHGHASPQGKDGQHSPRTHGTSSVVESPDRFSIPMHVSCLLLLSDSVRINKDTRSKRCRGNIPLFHPWVQAMASCNNTRLYEDGDEITRRPTHDFVSFVCPTPIVIICPTHAPVFSLCKNVRFFKR